ncbi:hypothetical protein D3C87_1485160 [compost metagenome]
MALVGIALCCGQKARQKRRTHIRHIGRDGVGQFQSGRTATEKLRVSFRDEGPRDGLQHATAGKRTARGAGAHLQRRQDAAVDGTEALQRFRLDVVDAMNAHDLFHQIGLAVDIRAPGRHGDGNTLARSLDAETETLENGQAFFRRNF